MFSDIEQIIHRNVETFLEQTAKEFDIPMAKLKENWKAHVEAPSSCLDEGTTEKSKKKTVKKTSLYQNFFVNKRVELLQKQPDLQFGELSFQISQMWNKMSKEEQKAYASKASTTTTVPTFSAPTSGTSTSIANASTTRSTSSTVSTVSTSNASAARVSAITAPMKKKDNKDGFDFESLNSMTMPELRKLCEEKGLRRTGNKLMLIQNLMGVPAPVAPTVPPALSLALPVMDEGEDVEVVVAKNMKRADIEEEIPDVFSDDEEDFDFEEEGSHYSVTQEDDD